MCHTSWPTSQAHNLVALLAESVKYFTGATAECTHSSSKIIVYKREDLDTRLCLTIS